MHGKPVAYAIEFLEEITTKHNCYWLTTHCRGGENRAPEYLLRMLPVEMESMLRKIQPTDWNALKTDAIDFTQDFRWFDDYALEAEIEKLRKNNCLDKFVRVDLKGDPEQLKDLLQLWKER